jgi:parallel beta-helix repeat protein
MNSHKKYWFFIIISLVFFVKLVFSQMNIPPGDVSGMWTKENSPYLINGDIFIPLDSTLTIDPGVVIEFQGHYNLNVQGQLLAVGTESDTIVFTVNDTTGFSNLESTNGSWRGISFIYTSSVNDSSKIVYCMLQYGNDITSSYPDCGGGAIRVYGFNKLLISHCLIERNIANSNDAPTGGGIEITDHSNITVINCTISRNIAEHGGGIMIAGNAAPSIINCSIINNHANDSGGGICSWSSGEPLIKNVTISGNTATFGGGINLYQSSPQFINNLIINNQASAAGGILFNGNSHATVINNTICNNNVSDGGGGILCHEDSHPGFVNTILYGNTADWDDQIGFWDEYSEPFFYHCDVEGGTEEFPGDNNIDTDPLFNEELEDDYSLSDLSPCIGAGTESVENDGDWFYAPATDIEGNPRPDPAESNPDIGAYENSMAAPHQAKISCSPDEITLDLEDVEIDSQIITITNSGLGDLHYFLTTNYTTVADTSNYALSFDGSGQYVDIANPETFNLNSDFTVTAWIKTESAGVILAKTSGEDDEGPKTFYVSTDGVLNFDVGWVDVVGGERIINDNLWHQIAVSVEFNGEDLIKFYIDGILDIENQDMDVNSYPEDDFRLKIGTDGREVEFYPHFQGEIDEVSVWNRVLTSTEIENSMLSSFTGSESGLLGYWTFNENSGTVTHDQSPNANNGTFQGELTWVDSAAPVNPWVYVSPNTGTVQGGSSADVTAYIDTKKLIEGNFEANLSIHSNDPDNPTLIIPVNLTFTAIEDPFSSQLPVTYALFQNYPNPFNPSTKIKFALPIPENVNIKVYNIIGQKLETILNKPMPAGYHEVEFNGQELASGVYLYLIEAGKWQDVKKMVVIK